MRATISQPEASQVVSHGGLISYPCLACGSLAEAGRAYCPRCLEQIGEWEERNPDADPTREWLRREIERAA
jgi:uncharacterized OB-fold protein